MNCGTSRAAHSWWRALSVLVLVLAAAAATADTGKPATRSGEATTFEPQDVTRIESRLSRLEQRLYSIETSIRGLEQQSRLSVGPGANAARDPEVGLLRAEVEALRLRLAEVECGLSRVDERTLTQAGRVARRKSETGAGDPCRLNADAPVRLSARP